MNDEVMRLELIDFDEEYQHDMESGAGFIIDDAGLSKDGKRNLNGIYSPLFGADLSTGSEINYDKYSCKCGALVGKFYEGQECPACLTKVEIQVDDIFRTGWMVFKYHYLINPQMYGFISRIIGPKNFSDIIKFNRDIDRDGFLQEVEGTPKNPFLNIGLDEFYKRFDEIIEYFAAKMKPEKQKFYDFILKHRDKVFINKFPVFSLILRPILINGKEIQYSDMNKQYQMLQVANKSLNLAELEIDKKPIKMMPVLYQAQELINEIHSQIITKLLAEKKGLIRSNHLGCRLNFSSRTVIVPLIEECEIDEVHLPYIVFLELYKFEIINLLVNLNGMTLLEANKKFQEGMQVFDENIYSLMDYLITNTAGGIKIIINRNPSLNLGSILVMRVTKIKRDITDVTMSIPFYVLGLLTADFDGDVINIISLKDKYLIDTYDKIFNPKMMLIDRGNCKFNRRMELIQAQSIGLFSFCNR